jgi:hypothetical protein
MFQSNSKDSDAVLKYNVLLFFIKKLRGCSPPANYTDRANAACREVSANFSG